VVDPVMKNSRVVVLNATSAIVTYEISYRITSPDRKEPETATPRQTTSAWAVRDGKWWCVYSETSVLGKDGVRSKAAGADEPWKSAETWRIKRFSFKDNALSDTKLEVVTDKDGPPAERLRVRLPAPADTAPATENVAEPLSVQLARINAANAAYTIEEAISIV